MIPRLRPEPPKGAATADYLRALKAAGFTGRILTRDADRLARSTDNSLYQLTPDAALLPKTHEDCHAALRLLADERFREITLTPRGGGTATSAHALSTGVILDTLDMNRVLEIDPEARTVRVQPGVVLDELNKQLKPHGLMFGPAVSTGSRATLGGMIATDGAGKGSCRHGKTSDQVASLRCLFPGGAEIEARNLTPDETEELAKRDDPAGALIKTSLDIATNLAAEIDRAFPKLSRAPSGYNLPELLAENGTLRLPKLLCGSEGTLGVVTEATLNLVPIPAHTRLIALAYDAFDDALRSAAKLREHEPAAVETMDEHLLALVRGDEAYLAVKDELEPAIANATAPALSLVELAGDDEAALDRAAAALTSNPQRVRATAAIDASAPARAAAYWTLRKNAVGLMAALPGARKPAAFVEDCAVPIETMPEFVAEFRDLLDAENLKYGMYGHADAGVIHVRPAVDATKPNDRAAVRRLTAQVADLAIKHHGLLWGEHGKGVRSAYTEHHHGPAVAAAFRRLKGAADPNNQLNPGKIATPPESAAALLTIDAPLRGERDAAVPKRAREALPDPFRCNGNALCHNESAQTVMCPSWKETCDRIHSPKGRADLTREWLRRLADAGANAERIARGNTRPDHFAKLASLVYRPADFSREVKDAMDGCLACKACAGQCPVKVDVPAFRARFLQAYHDRYARSPRDHAVAGIEHALPIVTRIPGAMTISNALAPLLGVVDPPALPTESLRQLLRGRNAYLDKPERAKPGDVIIVQDAFSTTFTPRAVVALLDLAERLAPRARLLPLAPSGKALHVKGFLRRFRAEARRQTERLARAANAGATLVGIDPAATLVYRDEYKRELNAHIPDVLLPQEWLATLELPRATDATPAAILPHCTERAVQPAATKLWTSVFASAGIEASVIEAGCCGMCGAYGHEREHAAQSRGIYDRGWRPALDALTGAEPLATGYSCREQVDRFSSRRLRHPLERLAEAL